VNNMSEEAVKISNYDYNDNLKLIRAAKKGDKNALNKLVEVNFPLVTSISKKFLNRGYEYEDIFQIGCMGLMKAINNFDETYNVKFSTYAVPMIMGEIRRFLRDDGMIKVSRSVKNTAKKLHYDKEALTKN
jgi:DNA-directed RNA polymerase specialized sigma subunit